MGKTKLNERIVGVSGLDGLICDKLEYGGPFEMTRFGSQAMGKNKGTRRAWPCRARP